jgi:hypothetical protein
VQRVAYSDINARTQQLFKASLNLLGEADGAQQAVMRREGADPPPAKGVDVVLTPVQTCGCLAIDGFRANVGSDRVPHYPIERWRKIRDFVRAPERRTYMPHDCHLPLGVMLAFVLRYARQHEDMNKLADERYGNQPARAPQWLRDLMSEDWIERLERGFTEARHKARVALATWDRRFGDKEFTRAVNALYERSKLAQQKYYPIQRSSGLLD